MKKLAFAIFKNNDNGQLLMLAGIIITISILSLAVVSISLSEATTFSNKNSFIKYEYDNVRTEFGVALKERLVDLSQYEDDEIDTIKAYIDDTKDIFVFTENLDGYYFDVIYDDNVANFLSNHIIEKGTDKIGLKLGLYLTNGDESIYEQSVEYII